MGRGEACRALSVTVSGPTVDMNPKRDKQLFLPSGEVSTSCLPRSGHRLELVPVRVIVKAVFVPLFVSLRDFAHVVCLAITSKFVS